MTEEGQLRECKCGPEKQTEPHTCPYQHEINDNSSHYCTCCSECRYECAMDI